MTETKTDNLDTDLFVESPEESTSPSADDFFEALDRKVNEGILEPEETTADNVQQYQSQATSEMSPIGDSDGGHNWEKRYTLGSDSDKFFRQFI